MEKLGLTTLMQLVNRLWKETIDSLSSVLTALKQLEKRRWAEARVDIFHRVPLVRAAVNIRRGLRNQNARAMLSELLRRNCPTILVKGDYEKFPRLDLAQYKVIAASRHVCIIRIAADDAAQVLDWPMDVRLQFAISGIFMIPHDKTIDNGDADVAQSLEESLRRGWHLLTVDDAKAILQADNAPKVKHLFLSLKNNWLTPAEEVAHFAGISRSLFGMCEHVVSTGMPTIVVYTPGLPQPFRLWRLNLRKIAVPGPAID
jgi:hypothetical protein